MTQLCCNSPGRFSLALAAIIVAIVADSAYAADVPREAQGRTATVREASPPAGLRRVAQAPGAAKARKAAAAGDAAVTPEREAAVQKFVQQHHPELSGLLESLKGSNEKEYHRAVRDLYRVTERLAQYYGRDDERYNLELKLWQTQSRLDLLAARLKMSESDELRHQVRQSLEEVYGLRQSLLRLERDRAAERVKKLDAQIQTLDASRDEFLERQLQTLASKSGKKASLAKEAAKKGGTAKVDAKSKADAKDAAADKPTPRKK
ncbi:MAG: hypothetical protein U0939_03810 [Pirellulales bacterium]